jgi:hypothetical protein
VLDERLSDEARFHGHDQDLAYVVEKRLDLLYRRVRIQSHGRGSPELTNFPREPSKISGRFHMRRDDLAAGVNESPKIAFGVRHHQVRLEWERGQFPEVLDDNWPQTEVPDEVTVHDVEMQHIDTRFFKLLDLRSEVSQVSTYDRSRKFDPHSLIQATDMESSP